MLRYYGTTYIIISLYDYVLVNKENDNVLIEKLLNILKLPSEYIPKIQKIFTALESKQPISYLFEGTSSLPQYQLFVDKVKSLKVPNNDKDKFFSVMKVIDAFSCGVDVLRTILNNFIDKFYQEFLVPFTKSYLVKPLNIFDVSIYERSTSLINVLTKIQEYSEYCFPDENETIDSTEEFKCNLSTLLSDYLSTKMNDDNNKTIEKLITKISPFTNNEVNLADVLINNFNISEVKIKFLFGLLENLTSPSKSYINALEGLQTIKSNYSSNIANLTNAITFINNINEKSNMKYLFEYLNSLEIWLNLTDSMCDFSNDKPICEYSFMKTYVGDEKCKKEMNSVIELSNFLISDIKMQDVDQKYQKIILDFIFPIINEIDQPISKFLKSFYLTLSSYLDVKADNNNIDFTNLIKKGGNVMDNFVTVIDDLVPDYLKKMPIIYHYYSYTYSKLRKVLGQIKTDNNIANILESIQEGGSVIVQMLHNGANSYVDMNTTIESITKGIQPSSFIDVYQTAYKFSSMNNKTMKAKRLADSITFDSATTKLSFNDVFPFKYFVLNSDELTDSMQDGFLSPVFLAKGFGNEYNDIQKSLKSIIESALLPPRKDIKEFAVGSGINYDYADAYLNAVCLFSQKVLKGENVLTKSDQYIQLNNEKTKKSGLSGGAIAGIVIAVLLVVGVAAFVGVYFYFKRRVPPEDKELFKCFV